MNSVTVPKRGPPVKPVSYIYRRRAMRCQTVFQHDSLCNGKYKSATKIVPNSNKTQFTLLQTIFISVFILTSVVYLRNQNIYSSEVTEDEFHAIKGEVVNSHNN